MILITGARGFVGNVLVRTLSCEQLTFLCAVRTNLHGNTFNANAVGHIDGNTSWLHLLTGVNTVVHLAARVHVMNDKSTDPLSEFREVNVEGTKNLALQAASAGVKRFIFLSSIKVNGEFTSPDLSFKADDIPQPEDAYAISKFEAEQALLDIARQTGMQVVIIRCPLVYGEGVKANFQSLMKAVSKGFPLPLGAVTDNRRSLVAIDNLVDFIITCTTHPNAANQVFMVSDGEDLSTAELLHRMHKACGSKDRLFKVPLNVLRLCASFFGKVSFYQRLCGSLQVDISKSKQLLNWTPPVSVDEGLRRAFKGH